MNGDGSGGMALGNGAGGDMSVEMDLQALVMGSESLLSHIARPDGIPRLTKSLAEIVSVTALLVWAYSSRVSEWALLDVWWFPRPCHASGREV